MAFNKTITHGQLLNKYLLGRMIFCEECGTALTGAQYHAHRYYRHQIYRGCKQAWSIRADHVEAAVFCDVYGAFGDSVKSAEAIQNAIPDPMRRKALEDQLFRCQRNLAKNEKQRNNVIDMIADGAITKTDVRDKMEEFRQREEALLKEANQLETQLSSIPSKEMIDTRAQLLKRMADDYFRSFVHIDDMTFDDQRALLQSLFSGKTIDGQRYGVYINRPKSIYTIKGDFGEFIGYLDDKLNHLHEDDPVFSLEFQIKGNISQDIQPHQQTEIPSAVGAF
jgi:hypothetical protein